MSTKIGRNAPCWCGSKVKYKKCHYAREQDAKISHGEAHKVAKSFKRTEKICSVPNSMKNKCTEQIIKAHTISKSNCLAEIADETNHVLGLKPSLSSLVKNKGTINPERIGINSASTFTGFCSYHDNKIFLPLETKVFSASDEQCFLFAYRTIARDIYMISGSENFISFMKKADKGKPLHEQKIIQALSVALDTNNQLDIKEFSEYKTIFDRKLEKKEYGFLSHFIIVLPEPPPVMVSATVAPFTNFNDDIIQDTTNPKAKLEHVIFNSFSNNKKGYITFTWLSEHRVIKQFIQSLQDIDSEKIFSALIGFFFQYVENIYFSPSWWKNLTEIQKISITEKIQQGMLAVPSHSLSDSKEEFGLFKIEEIKAINLSSSKESLPTPRPLRTVRESFPSYGSSLSKEKSDYDFPQ